MREETPVPIPRASEVSRGGNRFFKLFFIVLICIILITVLLFGLLFWAKRSPRPSSGAWQAVFLTNNQVYFGHLKNYSQDYAVLRDVFYLRVADPIQGSTAQNPSLNLVKLGAELHGPEDVMYIPTKQIMFWENLKSDAQVVQAITNFLKEQ
jgi:membrane-associated protease RseP (regulator of RpoE activity)